MPVEFEIKVVKVGNSLRVTIPKEVCRALSITEGATVGVSTTDSQIRIRLIR